MNRPHFRAEAADRRLRLDIYDTIGADWLGQGITAKSVSAAIAAAGDVDQIDVYINSPGGDAFDGIAIYNELKQFKGQVNTYAMGIAASAASVIFMAGDQRVVYDGAQVMIHNASGFTFGDKKTHEKQTKVLGKLDAQIAKVYAKTTGGDEATIAELMNEETWLDPSDAIADGFATHKSPQEAVPPPAARMLNAFTNVPLKVAAWAGQTSGVSPLPTVEQPKMEDEPKKEDDTMEDLKNRLAELEAKIAAMEGDDEEEPKPEEEETPDAKAIATAFAHDQGFALQMIGEGKTLAEAHAAYTAHAAEQITTMRKHFEAANDGADPVRLAVSDGTAEPDRNNPETLAAWEWDNSKTVFKASSRDRYINSRVAELTGKLRIS